MGGGVSFHKSSQLPVIATTYSLEKIDDAGHFILVEKPEETAGLITQFLGKV